MRILWHMPRLHRAGCGLSHRALRLARGLARGGHEVVFVVAEDRTDAAGGRINEFAVQRHAAPRRKAAHWSIQSFERLRFAVRTSEGLARHDLFVTCQPEMVIAYRRLGTGRPVIFICGGSALLQEPRELAEQRSHSLIQRSGFAIDRMLRRRLERRAFRAAGAVVFDSLTTRSLIVRSYGVAGDKCRAIIGGVDSEEFQPATAAEKIAIRESLGIAPNLPVIVWSGRLSPEKNVALLIRAAARCAGQCGLLLVGDGPLRSELVRLSQAEGIAERTSWPGRVADVRPFLRAADVFAFPSLGESFGASLVEAMACGLPCVALQPDGRLVRTANAEILEHGVTGWLVEGASDQTFVASLDRLLGDGGLRRRLGAAARSKSEQAFDWRRAGEELAELVNTVNVQPLPRTNSPRDGLPCVLPSTSRC